MDPLKQTMLDRAMTPQAPQVPQVPQWPSISTPPPAVPPTTPTQVPPRWQRFETAQKMQDAYRNDWTPNPMLVRILEGGR